MLNRFDSSESGLDHHRVNLSIDLFESLPTPYGLSRYGVAPDHPEVKNCEHKFAEVAEDPRFRYFGNTQVIDNRTREESLSDRSAYIKIADLRQDYDVVILAYGAELDRSLGGIPGEELSNILPARTAVSWYNGYPIDHHHSTKTLDLSQVEHVTIIGQGNVALDIARILLTDIDILAKTDISQQALESLSQSRVKHVDILGRRGPLQVSFTTKELRELIKLKGVDFGINQDVLIDAIERMKEPGVMERMPNGRMAKRILDLMYQACQGSKSQIGNRTCTLKFLHTPLSFHPIPIDRSTGKASRVKSIEWGLNQLVYPDKSNDHPTDYSSVRAIPIEPEVKIISHTDLVLKSIGYQPVMIDPLQLDEYKNCARNQGGRVLGPDKEIIPGLYVTGWLASGPNGVIGDTMYRAFETVDNAISDLQQQNRLDPDPHRAFLDDDSFEPRLINRKNRIDWNQWKVIDSLERSRGSLRSKPREKILTVHEMLRVLESS